MVVFELNTMISPATNPGLLDFIKPILDLSGPGMLVLALIALWRGWVVFPREIEVRDKRIADLVVERDEFKNMALTALDVGERLTANVEERGRRR